MHTLDDKVFISETTKSVFPTILENEIGLKDATIDLTALAEKIAIPLFFVRDMNEELQTKLLEFCKQTLSNNTASWNDIAVIKILNEKAMQEASRQVSDMAELMTNKNKTVN